MYSAIPIIPINIIPMTGVFLSCRWIWPIRDDAIGLVDALQISGRPEHPGTSPTLKRQVYPSSTEASYFANGYENLVVWMSTRASSPTQEWLKGITKITGKWISQNAAVTLEEMSCMNTFITKMHWREHHSGRVSFRSLSQPRWHKQPSLH